MNFIVVLTGAGISAPSGIETFRAADGLWNGHKVEEVASPEGFETNPNKVYKFYNERRSQLSTVKPNAAHIALAKLFEDEETDFVLVTQNVDDLHERGGVEELFHMHGELKQSRCVDCWHIHDCYGGLTIEDMCPNCNGRLRPNIVWFGEGPFHLNQIDRCLKKCDIFLCIGTSGMVAPASEFVLTAKNHGAKTIEFNLEETAISHRFDERIQGDVTRTVPDWVDEFLSQDPF